MNRDTSATIEGAVATAGGANERELLARVAEGDSAAGRELVRRYDRLIAAAARRMLFSPADVDDVVQETFLILLVSADSDPRSRSAGTLAVDDGEQPGPPHRPPQRPQPAGRRHRGPRRPERGRVRRGGVGARAGEQCVALREAMASITSEERHLIRLLTVEDRPCYATISAATSRPVGSLGPTRRRILGKLRAHPAMARVAVAA